MNNFSINLKSIPFVLGLAFALALFGGITFADFLFPFFLLLLIFDAFLNPKEDLFSTSNKKLIMSLLFFSYMFSLLISDLQANIGYSIVIKDQIKLLSVYVISLLVSSHKFQATSFVKYFIVSYCIANLFVLVASGEMSVGDHNFWRHGIGESVSLGIVAILPFNRKSISIFALFTLALVNIFMDFRGMALVLFLACVFLSFVYISTSGAFKKIVAITVLLFIIFGGAYSFFLSQNLYENRRGQSNLVRAAMVYTAVSDMLKPTFFGHGSEHFKQKFKIPNIANPNLKKSIDGTLPLHGYLFSASYDAGKLGLLFYIYLLTLIVISLARKIIKVESLYEFSSTIILIYFAYSCFMHAFSGFDRVLLGFSMGIILVDFQPPSKRLSRRNRTRITSTS